MAKVIIVQGEHPFDPYWPLEVYASEASAAARCAELTREFLAEYWGVANEDEPIPDVTIENWSDIAEKYGEDRDFIQDDNWGRWWVGMEGFDVRP